MNCLGVKPSQLADAAYVDLIERKRNWQADDTGGPLLS